MQEDQLTRTCWLIPTHNEERTIGDVIEQISVGHPYVLDRSTDNTAQVASRLGATVIQRKGEGKGEAVREGIELLGPISDVIVIVDGDNTYPPSEAHRLLDELSKGADMAVGSRFLGSMQEGAMDRLNYWGNKLFAFLISKRFGSRITDPISGFRAIKTPRLKDIDLNCDGFEIEVELTAEFLRRNLKIVEVPIVYAKRPNDSASKVRALRDGCRILLAVLTC